MWYLIITSILFVVITIIFIVFYAIPTRTGAPRATLPGGITMLTVYNALWLTFSYIVVLWGIKLTFPNYFNAWYNGCCIEFIVTQVLLIAMIGILSLTSPWFVTNGLKKLAWIPGIIALFLTISTIRENLNTYILESPNDHFHVEIESSAQANFELKEGHAFDVSINEGPRRTLSDRANSPTIQGGSHVRCIDIWGSKNKGKTIVKITH